MRGDVYARIAERYQVPGSDDDAIERFFLDVAPTLSREEREAIVAELQADQTVPMPSSDRADLPTEVPIFSVDDAPPIVPPSALAQFVGELSAAVEQRVSNRLESIERALDTLHHEVADLKPALSRQIGALLDGRAPAHAHPHDTVREVVRRMTEQNVGAVAVLDGAKLVGIFSERDLMQRVVAEGRDLDQTSVASVMTTEIGVAEPQESIAGALKKMYMFDCGYLPVVAHGDLVGMLSLVDLLTVDSCRPVESTSQDALFHARSL